MSIDLAVGALIDLRYRFFFIPLLKNKNGYYSARDFGVAFERLLTNKSTRAP